MYRNCSEEIKAIFFVQATPRGKLAKECKKEFTKSGLKVKLVERTGKLAKNNLIKSNPFKKTGCGKGRKICRMGVDCKAWRVHYRISCGDDGFGDAKYEGETSRSNRD